MFIAMNRFEVHRDKESEFEELWTNRDSHLKGVAGFMAFHLLRGPTSDEHTLFASHSIWASKEAFLAWTKSEAFRLAHKDAKVREGLYAGAPRFEGFEVRQEITA